jgi:hypothetical protein
MRVSSENVVIILWLGLRVPERTGSSLGLTYGLADFRSSGGWPEAGLAILVVYLFKVVDLARLSYCEVKCLRGIVHDESTVIS